MIKNKVRRRPRRNCKAGRPSFIGHDPLQSQHLSETHTPDKMIRKTSSLLLEFSDHNLDLFLRDKQSRLTGAEGRANPPSRPWIRIWVDSYTHLVVGYSVFNGDLLTEASGRQD